MTTPPPRILITAGPTHEPIDRVRFLGNRSSGRTGIALAEAARDAGFPTTLLLGPVSRADLAEDSHLRVERFRTAAELERGLRRRWPEHDVLIMAAAVADFRPAEPAAEKIRRGDAELTLRLEPTPDLLASLQPLTRPDQTVIAFALEPRADLERSAREKLRRKGAAAVVANPLETMDSPEIEAFVILRDGSFLRPEPSGPRPKDEFARWLIGSLDRIRRASSGARRTSAD